MYYYYVLLYPYFLSTNAIISDLMMWMYVCYCWFSLVVLAVLLPTTQSVGNVTFSYADKDQYFMISSQCLSLRVYMWGGAGYTGASCLGGGGAYVEGDLPLQQPGTSNITVKAGSSGFVCFSTGKCYGGNTASILSGGGRSAIMISNVEVVVAGGGGAGASCTNCQPPCIPGGSATSARNGTIEPTSYQGGPNGIMSTSPTQFPFDCYYSNGTKRGTFQSSSGGGGTSATVGLGGNPNGGPGKGHKGGTGVSSAYYNYVGEGGGGYFGGGGGSNNYDKTCNLGAGGGGSSYLYNLINYQNSESAGYNGIAAGMQSKYWGKGHGYAAGSGDSLNGFVALECSKCVAGSAVSDVTADCVPCPPGTYITEGSTTCIPCPTGTYQSSYSSGSCKACPYGSITNAEGSTGKVDCVDPLLNFVIGCLCIILCFVGVLLYLYFGRLQRVAFQRKNRLANKCMLLFIRVINKLEAFQELMTKLMNLKYIKQLEWFDNLRNALFIILCVLLFIVTIVLVLLSAMARVIFRSTVLWRGYSFLLRLPGFLYEHLHKFLVAMDINLPYINFSLIFYPVLEVIGVIGDLKVDLGGVNITCTGSQQPVYLLINFVIAAILVIIIQSDIQLLWLHGIPDVNKTFMQMLMRKLSNCKTYLDILRLLGYTFYAMLLAIIPTPKAILQYSFGLLTFSRYFADHGVSKSNSVCDKALSVPLDSMLAYFSTALLCFAIVPTIYIIAGTIITSFTPAQIIFDDGKPSLTPYKPIQDKSEHDGKHTIVVPTDNSGGIELKTFGTTSSLDKSVEVASSTNVTTEENESASLNIMHYASQCWQTLFTPFAFDWFFLNAVTKIAIWIVRVVHSYFEDVETIVSDTSRADDAVNEIMDECKNSLNQSLPKIPWFHYFQSYSKDKAFRMEMMEEKQLWKKEIHRFPSYVHFIHAVRDELYENATSYHPIIRRVYADVFCWFPLVHWCWSTVGLGYWIRIVRNYIQFLLISFGIWNESTTRDFQLIEKYSTYLYLFEKDLINELNEINCNDVEQATCKEIESPVDKETEEYLKCERESIYVLTKAYQGAEQIQKKIESKFEETESTSAEPIDSKSLRIEEYREDFPRFLYSVVAPRLVLFQIIPALTGLSLLAVDMCACPLFVEDKVVRNLSLPLLLNGIHDAAVNAYKSEYGEEFIATWKVYCLVPSTFIEKSRLVQAYLAIIGFVTSVVIIFYRSWIDKVSIIFTVSYIIVGIAEFGSNIVQLHHYMYCLHYVAPNQESNADRNSIIGPVDNPLAQTTQDPNGSKVDSSKPKTPVAPKWLAESTASGGTKSQNNTPKTEENNSVPHEKISQLPSLIPGAADCTTWAECHDDAGTVYYADVTQDFHSKIVQDYEAKEARWDLPLGGVEFLAVMQEDGSMSIWKPVQFEAGTSHYQNINTSEIVKDMLLEGVTRLFVTHNI